jgi:S-(hydroxymethyl)glutathione dehydrogenase/alcohol dehydrogenase
MKSKAVVAHALNKLSVETVDIDEPKAGEVLVKIGATGVCHSDLSVLNGTIPMPLPMVLGHEGAGVVVKVGAGVTNVAAGDHVVLSFVPSCGQCFFCERGEHHFCSAGIPNGMMLDGTARVHLGGKDLATMQFLGCMSEYSVVPSISVVKIDKNLPFEQAALVGCGVMTGVGAAIKTAGVTPGSTVAVFGCGGVGLSVIQGARISGAKTIIGVDLNEDKLSLAKEFGATHTVNASSDPVGPVRAITGGVGVDYSFEVIGIPAVMSQAYASARRGGTVCIVGLGRITESFPLNAMLASVEGKKTIGSFYGNANFRVDMPMLLDLYKAGKLDLDRMITKTYGIDDAAKAFEDLQSGVNARGVIVYE